MNRPRPAAATVLWFRRDLRLRDNPALGAAAEANPDGFVLPLFVVDERLWGTAGPVRQAYLAASLRALSQSLDGRLLVRHGDPTVVVPEVAAACGAVAVHCAADHGPYGSARDTSVADALARDHRELIQTGSAYAVSPGRVRKADGERYRVYTPFFRAWCAHGWRAPAADPPRWPTWHPGGGGALRNEGIPAAPDLGGLSLPAAGEAAAAGRWSQFRRQDLDRYHSERDRPDLSTTSMMSAHLKWGEIHPRTLLADLGDSPAHQTYRKELAWREFYADVLDGDPRTAWANLNPRFDALPVEDDAEQFTAWSLGRTGFPFVDAGMRQLLAEGWMHNRVRMVVASFLVKDLHLAWQRGAAWFLRYLRDGDVASNQHGWQWVAGCGTDAAPYYRVFNPVAQGLRFDPDGDYVRRYVPELGHLVGSAAHEPWSSSDGYLHHYPLPIVDHAVERAEALLRYEQIRTPS